MKRGITIVLSALLSASAAAAEPAATPEVEFSGVLTADGRTKLALTNTATGVTRWVDPGGEFHGFVVASYDARDEAVTLQRGGQEYRLPMVAPKDSKNPATGSGPTLRGGATASASRVPPPPPAPVLAPEPPAASPGVPAGAPTGATGNATITRSVQPGETLDMIARNAGLTREQLQALNPNVNAGSLQVGQVIRIR